MNKTLLKQSLKLNAFGWIKIPVLGWMSPRVIVLDQKRCVIKVPLNFRTKNHLNTMYFGILCAGADMAAGLHAMEAIQKNKNKIQFVFKDFNAQFLRRADSDTYFVCEQGDLLEDLVRKASESSDRVEQKVCVNAYTHYGKSEFQQQVASFELTISLKKYNKNK